MNQFFDCKIEIWSEADCARKARNNPPDHWGNRMLWPGYIGDHYGSTRYNGGCVRNEKWYPGENVILPRIHKDYDLIHIPTWGWFIYKKSNNLIS